VRRLCLVCFLVVAFAACRSKSEPATESKEAPVVAPPSPPPNLTVPTLVDEKTTELPDGITLREVHLDREGVPMTLWIYRKGPKEQVRPAIFIAPAGTTMVWGSELTELTRAQHLPWAERSYLVVAYSLDGATPTEADEATAQKGVAAFTAARAGLDNFYAAVAFALANESVDAKRMIVAGHSSAATVALWVGSQDARIAAIIAFAPGVSVMDAAQNTRADITVEQMEILRKSSPLSNLASLRTKRLFLFHAADDDIVPKSELDNLLTPLSDNKRMTFTTVLTGGHYNSMIADGIPKAAQWLEGL
jgi:dienelactone hydrolase